MSSARLFLNLTPAFWRTLATMLAATVLSLPARAEQLNPMVGDWRASGGFTVHIPDAKGAFELVFERPKERVMHPAKWITVGQQFIWTDKQNAKHAATFERDAKGQMRIRDVGEAFPDSPAFWYRIEPPKKQ